MAADVTLSIAKRKAYTAMAFVTPISQINRLEAALAEVHQLFFLAGGVPITAAGTLYGAIGVSGSPKSVTNEACAKAGVIAIQQELELQED